MTPEQFNLLMEAIKGVSQAISSLGLILGGVGIVIALNGLAETLRK